MGDKIMNLIFWEKNIEEWFLKQKKGLPQSGDYISNYGVIKNFFETNIHPNINSIVQKIDNLQLTNHGQQHINKVIQKATELLNIDKKVLNAYEMFFLLLAIQAHDAGHIINGRTGHEKEAKEIINGFDKALLSSVEKSLVLKIIETHSGKDDPINMKLKDEQIIHDITVHPKVIAGILRLADELSDDFMRTSTFLLDKGLILDECKLFHAYANYLHTCKAEPIAKQVTMRFAIPYKILLETYFKGKDKIYLIDEIYERTLKTFRECIYCNRFLPYDLRIEKVKVDIEFIEADTYECSIKGISYCIEEIGYPAVDTTIYSICSESLVKDGHQLDGTYIAGQIKIKS